MFSDGNPLVPFLPELRVARRTSTVGIELPSVFRLPSKRLQAASTTAQSKRSQSRQSSCRPGILTMNKNFLKIPLNKLYFIDDVETFSGLSIQDLDSLRTEYDESELNEIIESIKWARQNPDFDFLSLLPKLKHSNEDIYKYLCKLEFSLSRL